jgi:transposase
LESLSSAGARKRTRRYRSSEERCRIVEETLISGVSVATVARAHELNANQLFHWRKLYQAGLLGNDVGRPRMLPVTVCCDGASEALLPGTLSELRASDSSPMPQDHAGSIELTVGKAQVRIAGTVDAAALRVVLECLLR